MKARMVVETRPIRETAVSEPTVVKDSGAYFSQYCASDQNFFDFLKSIPQALEITELYWYFMQNSKWRKMFVHPKLQKVGVKRIRINDATTMGDGTFKNLSRETMIDTMKELCKSWKVEPQKVCVGAVRIADRNKNFITLQRTRKCYKQSIGTAQKPKTRNRKKMVLGLVAHSKGTGFEKLLEKVSATKAKCTITEEIKRLHICEGI